MNEKMTEGQTIPVDAGKLARALRTTFEGVALVFDSIGVDADVRIMDTSVPSQVDEPPVKTGGKAAARKEKGNGDKTEDATEGSDEEASDVDTADGDIQHTDVPSDVEEGGSAEEMAESVADEGTEDESQDANGQSSQKATDTGSVTQDDITKIIVQKIKKDRGNNEKIGQLLKTYGVAKVGDLPSSKYEAFLTDISEL